MLRALLAVLFLSCGGHNAVAQVWSTYHNTHIGYEISVPHRFDPADPERSDNPGQSFMAPDFTAQIRVWGGRLDQNEFKRMATRELDILKRNRMTVHHTTETGNSFTFTGSLPRALLYRKMKAFCGGTIFAAFEVTFYPDRIDEVQTMVTHMGVSLRSTNCT